MLSVLYPAKDMQSSLSNAVVEILDAAADTGHRFELLIIDDGSTDATNEVAHEITCHYPQVRLIRHETSLGREAAVRTGLQHSRGDVVVLCDGDGGFRVIERRSHLPHSAVSRPAEPNFLRRIKKFALGE